MNISTQFVQAANLLEEAFETSERDNDLNAHFLLADRTVTKLLVLVRELAACLNSVRLARVVRPNGKTYRATKPAEAVVLPGEGVVVLRTHDLEVAVTVASLEHPEITDETPHRRAWWGTHVSSQRPGRVFYESAERGVPVVIFDVA